MSTPQGTAYLTEHLAGQVVLATAPPDNSILLMYADNRVVRFYVTPDGKIAFLLTALAEEH